LLGKSGGQIIVGPRYSAKNYEKDQNNSGIDLRRRPKAYIDLRRRLLEFVVGDKVFLKVYPTKKIMCVSRKSKLDLDVDPFEVLERVGLIAYRLALPLEMEKIHFMYLNCESICKTPVTSLLINHSKFRKTYLM